MERLLADAMAATDRPVSALHVRLGKLSGVVPEALAFAFDALIQETRAAGAALRLEEAPVRMFCRHCAHTFVADVLAYACPLCQRTDGDLVGGREVELVEVEVFENV